MSALDVKREIEVHQAEKEHLEAVITNSIVIGNILNNFKHFAFELVFVSCHSRLFWSN